ncbi:MAG: parC [Chlamydiia bacterium]|nr:parC [Chlamydiia bacterium]
MQDVKYLMRDHYLRYASYVILDRAIPHIIDGLKPVQRRILHTLYKMHDGKFHKVANAVGQTMAYHPHGDAPINEALVNLANKGFLLDCQGNFGNLFTGDSAAAARYIETRLSQFAKETLFNPQLTTFIPSYDGRNSEPVTFPAKIPLLLMQGAEGIAVGMSTRIFPHNFVELIEAEIAILEGKSYRVMPDFYTGGIADCSEYNKGRGKIRLRAKIEIKDPKTIVIRETCYGTTTEALIGSIEEAAKKGKIKIDSIHDYTAEKVEIEIKLPRGQYAEEIIDHLYAYTDCEVSLNSQMTVIRDGKPCETDVDEILQYHVELLQGYHKAELDIEEKEALAAIFDKTLEQVFIENRLYKNIEELESYDEVYAVLDKSFKPYLKILERAPLKEDYERLLSIPIRRIGRFDIEKNQADIKVLEEKIQKTRGHLKRIKEYTIAYLQALIKKYGDDFPRRTRIKRMEEVDKRAIETKEVAVGFDAKTGYVGIKVESKKSITCTNFDKLLILYKSGNYKVISIPEKQYIGQEKDDILHVGVADKETVFSVCYKETGSGLFFAKRFIVKQFILDKVYRFLEDGVKLHYITTGADKKLLVHLVPKPKQKMSVQEFDFAKVLIKSVQSKGVRVASRPVMEVKEL